MPDDLPITDERPQKHRAGAWVVLVIGLIGLGLGLTQWRGSFGQVFAKKVEIFKTPAQIEEDRIQGMKTRDTDGDGINDYEESYVYKTSPYLQDSDSDGSDDRTELAKGDDPNCPKDRACGGLGLTETLSASGTAAVDPSAGELEALDRFLNPTPDEIRQILMQSGVDPEQIAGIDDATLLQLYRESLAEAQANIEE